MASMIGFPRMDSEIKNKLDESGYKYALIKFSRNQLSTCRITLPMGHTLRMIPVDQFTRGTIKTNLNNPRIVIDEVEQGENPYSIEFDIYPKCISLGIKTVMYTAFFFYVSQNVSTLLNNIDIAMYSLMMGIEQYSKNMNSIELLNKMRDQQVNLLFIFNKATSSSYFKFENGKLDKRVHRRRVQISLLRVAGVIRKAGFILNTPTYEIIKLFGDLYYSDLIEKITRTSRFIQLEIMNPHGLFDDSAEVADRNNWDYANFDYEDLDLVEENME